MPIPRRLANPFFAMLLVVGTLFVVTACAYAVMAFQTSRNPWPADEMNRHPLHEFIRAHGDITLLGQVLALGVLTTAAIATDSFWMGILEKKRTGAKSLPSGSNHAAQPVPVDSNREHLANSPAEEGVPS